MMVEDTELAYLVPGTAKVFRLTREESREWCERDARLRAIHREAICANAAAFATDAACDFAWVYLADGRLASVVSADYGNWNE